MRPARITLFYIIIIALLAGLWFIVPDWSGTPGRELPVKLAEYFSSSENIPSEPEATEAIYTIDTLVVTEGTDTLFLNPRLDLDSIYKERGKLRILYYGDSQLEGDRITSGLRSALRQRYGGSGPGLILPLMPVMYTRSVEITSSSNWRRYTYLSFMDGAISHKRLGPMNAYNRFTDPGTRYDNSVSASLKITPSIYSDSSTAVYSRLSIIYGGCTDSLQLEVISSGKKIFSGYLPLSVDVTSFATKLGDVRDLTLTFRGRSSPDIYGISVSDSFGVTVDNVPLRGSAGFDFSMNNRKSLADGLQLIDPDVIILHFGLNVVKNIRSEYGFYTKGLYRQIDLLKTLCPRASIIIVGVTDMAYSDSDTVRSYRNIPALIRAQSDAADSAGVEFWNVREAMGGENSIIRWSGKTPPLAQADLTHITYEGSDSISELMVRDLFAEKILIRSVIDTLPSQPIVVEPLPTQGDQNMTFESQILSVVKDVFRFNQKAPFMFTTLYFWLFFLILLTGYSIVYKGRYVRSLYLLAFSLYFYYKSGGLFFGLLILSTLVDYSAGRILGKSSNRSFRKLILIISLFTNLGMLVYFKYAGFLTDLINDIAGTDLIVTDWLARWSNDILGTGFDTATIILPVGISFFTFQTISYTIDVYRRKVDPVRNIFDFGFYVSFFPQLVAGPIVRASEFIPQIYEKYHLHRREFSQALFLIISGLIKKIIVSDYISVNFVDRVFHDPSLFSGFENLMAVYGYGLQIYCDFSGYTDIALGVALILGFRLPLNFNSPYKARNLSDFWRRWHISLSRWLRDYLYIPLGGNRKGALATAANIMVTMILGGLWHGASLKFLFWGALHGLGLVAGRVTGKLKLFRGRVGRAISIFITFNFVSFCWIFFRGESFGKVKIMLAQITSDFGGSALAEVIYGYRVVFTMILAGYIIHFLPFRIKEAYRALFIKTSIPVKIIIVIVVVILLTLVGSAAGQPFIYFRF